MGNYIFQCLQFVPIDMKERQMAEFTDILSAQERPNQTLTPGAVDLIRLNSAVTKNITCNFAHPVPLLPFGSHWQLGRCRFVDFYSYY